MEDDIEDLLVKIYKRLAQEDFDPLSLMVLNYTTDFKKNVEWFIKTYENTTLKWLCASYIFDLKCSFDDVSNFNKAKDIVDEILWDYLEENKNE